MKNLLIVADREKFLFKVQFSYRMYDEIDDDLGVYENLDDDLRIELQKLNDKFDRINRKIRKIALTVVLGSVVGIVGHIYAMQTLPKIGNKNSTRITSQTHLEEVLEIEKKKLGCYKYIEARLVDETCGIAEKKDGIYIIEIGGEYATISTLKHELYHIHDGHVEEPHSIDRYYFVLQPQAIAYQLFGWRL